MSIVNHVGILLHASLDAPRPSKRNPTPKYHAMVAFPAAAKSAIDALALEAAPKGTLQGLHVTRYDHHTYAPDKQFPGIPQDAVIVRFHSGADHAPELYSIEGPVMRPTPRAEITSTFFAGQRVRVNSYAFYYAKGDAGISFNLSGLLSVGGGERRAGSGGGPPSAEAFAAFADPNAAPAPAPATAAAPAPATAADPFAANSNSPF